MYFITKGGLDYKQEDKEVVAVEKGTWLCEAVLWTSWTHCGTARANTECRLLVLDAAKFQDIVGNFPSEHASQYASEYVDLINTLEPVNLSDLHMESEAVDEVLERVFPEENEGDSDDEVEDGCQSTPSVWSKFALGGATNGNDSPEALRVRSPELKDGERNRLSETMEQRQSRGRKNSALSWSSSSKSRRHSANVSRSSKRENQSVGKVSRHSSRASWKPSNSKKQKVGFHMSWGLGIAARQFAHPTNRRSSQNADGHVSTAAANRGSCDRSFVVPA